MANNDREQLEVAFPCELALVVLYRHTGQILQCDGDNTHVHRRIVCHATTCYIQGKDMHHQDPNSVREHPEARMRLNNLKYPTRRCDCITSVRILGQYSLRMKLEFSVWTLRVSALHNVSAYSMVTPRRWKLPNHLKRHKTTETWRYGTGRCEARRDAHPTDALQLSVANQNKHPCHVVLHSARILVIPESCKKTPRANLKNQVMAKGLSPYS